MNISPTIVSALEKQADHERFAATAYQAMSLWCAVKGHSGFASFFANQCKEELEHAGKIHEHLVDRGILPKLGAIPAADTSYSQVVDLAERAYQLECANSAGIIEVYETALAEKDYPVQALMQWFITEQVEEEAWSSGLLDKVREASCAGALLNLDRHVTKMFGDAS